MQEPVVSWALLTQRSSSELVNYFYSDNTPQAFATCEMFPSLQELSHTLRESQKKSKGANHHAYHPLHPPPLG